MLSPITDVARTRTLGGLSTDEGTGAPTEPQIEAAIRLGQEDLIKAVGKDSYVTVRDFSPTDLDTAANADQLEAYSKAESYFAMAALPQVMKVQQLSASGFTQQTTLGQATVQYATVQDAIDAGKPWYNRALAVIAAYLLGDGDDDDGVTSEDGTFSFDAMGHGHHHHAHAS